MDDPEEEHAVANPELRSPVYLATIGYESTTVARLVDALRDERVDSVVDVRAVANSRRPGFAKTRLSGHLAEAGIGYLHLRGLGTPAEGRAAARSGRYEVLRDIFRGHLHTPEAQHDLAILLELVTEGRRVCLLCLEANPEHCHRTLVAAEVEARVGVSPVHLHPDRSVTIDP
jgi:uncharacterized protein (DUF488 family)